jgi:predicted amidohydrolase YtcJ
MQVPDDIVEDLDGLTVIPGLIDPHQHFSMAVFEPAQVDCGTPPIDSLEQVLDRLERAAQTELPGRWIRGWGFHWSRVKEQRSPTRADLDRVAPDNPLILMDASYHGCFVNSHALAAAGIDRHSQPGRAGIIVLDEHGEVEGTLLETAMDRPEALSWASYVDRDPALALDLVETLARRQMALGITSITDALVLPRAAALYRRAEEEGRLPIPLGQVFGGQTFFDPPIPDRASSAMGDAADGGRLRGGMVKVFVDAVHPSPAIDRPVDGKPAVHTCVIYYGQGELADLALAATERSMGVAMHALGDCAIDQALEACSAVRATEAGREADLRIEHFVLASREQAQRAADLGVIVVTNPGFVDTWGDQYLERWNIDGRPELHVLPLRDLLDAGVTVASASDYPCDELDPFHGISAAVARRSWTGDELHPEQAITPLEALRLSTRSAAEASGTAAEDGSIEPGKRANLAVLDRDPLSCSTDQLKSVRVLRTYVDGLLAFEDDRVSPSNEGRRSPATT